MLKSVAITSHIGSTGVYRKAYTGDYTQKPRRPYTDDSQIHKQQQIWTSTYTYYIMHMLPSSTIHIINWTVHIRLFELRCWTSPHHVDTYIWRLHVLKHR